MSRHNIYAEEIDGVTDVETIGRSSGRRFYGVRVHLKSPPELRREVEGDDDMSAVTFWFVAPEDRAEFKAQVFDA